MTRTKYSDEFKERVVREILEKERTIASVAASYDPGPPPAGARQRTGHPTGFRHSRRSRCFTLKLLSSLSVPLTTVGPVKPPLQTNRADYATVAPTLAPRH